MRSDNQVPARQQGVPFAQAIVTVLVGDHISCNASQPIRTHCSKQSCLIDKLAAGSIDEIAALQRIDLILADYRWLSGTVTGTKHDDPACFDQEVDIRRSLPLRHRWHISRITPGHVRTKRIEICCQARTHATETDNPDPISIQLIATAGIPVPSAGGDIVKRPTIAPQQGQNQSEGMLGGSTDRLEKWSFSAQADHPDTAGSQSRLVDVVVPGRRAAQPAKAGRHPEEGAIDAMGEADEKCFQRRKECRQLTALKGSHLSQAPQGRQRLGRKAVGFENAYLHNTARSSSRSSGVSTSIESIFPIRRSTGWSHTS